MVSNQTIFIHAWWRSGSTYVWSKLREIKSCCCYFEPLNPSIAEFTLSSVEKSPNVNDARNLRHPTLKTHYFAEYAELLRSARLSYSPDLAYDRYLLLPSQPDERLHNYIEGLISSAFAGGRRAILCFCRSQMRSAWIKQTFSGHHVAQIRNPADQWASFKSYQSEIRPNFPLDMTTIALKLRHLYPTAFAHIEDFELFAQQLSKRPSVPMNVIGHYFIPQFIRQRDCLDIFLVIWVASALQAIAYCDFILDIDMLSTDLEYRNTVSNWFDSVGCSINFSDCSSPTAAEPNPTFDRAVEDAVKAIKSNASALVVTDPEVVKNRLPLLSPLSRRILSLALLDE
jgi:hypothetical protein